MMATHHYLGFERLVGESLKNVALLEGDWVALIGWGTAAFNCEAIAVDGKTLRGSASDNHKAIHLLSALVRKQGVVAAPCAVDT
ncbi:MAG: ISAs1 family transposase, partial [Bacillota bacterium]